MGRPGFVRGVRTVRGDWAAPGLGSPNRFTAAQRLPNQMFKANMGHANHEVELHLYMNGATEYLPVLNMYLLKILGVQIDGRSHS